MLGLASSLTIPHTKVFWDSYSMKFDGADSYITSDSFAPYLDKDTGTASFWVRQPLTSTTGQMFSCRVDGNNFIQLFYHANSNTTKFSYKGGGSSVMCSNGTTIENTGNWHHIAATWDTTADEIKLYIDGVLRDTQTSLPTISGTFAVFDIGQNTNGGAYFSGSMNDISIWGEVKDISKLYNSPAGSVGAGQPKDESTDVNRKPPILYITFERPEIDIESHRNEGSVGVTPTFQNITAGIDDDTAESGYKTDTPTNPA